MQRVGVVPATSGECGAVTEMTSLPVGAVVVVTVMRLLRCGCESWAAVRRRKRGPMPGGMICDDSVCCVSSIDAHDFRASSAHELGFDPLQLGEQSS
jgi:hypothetical protein